MTAEAAAILPPRCRLISTAVNGKRFRMRQRIERSSTSVIPMLAALLAVLGANAAVAGDASTNEAVGAPQCGSPGETCAHISGYIRAGSEFPGSSAQRPGRFAPSPLLASPGVVGRGGVDASSPGMVLLNVSGDAPTER
jgi:hypothetical protein